MEATVRHVRVDGTKVKVCGIGKFEQALCEPVKSIYLIIYDENVLEQAVSWALTECLEANKGESRPTPRKVQTCPNSIPYTRPPEVRPTGQVQTKKA